MVTLGTFRKKPQPVMERRKEQAIAEQSRLRELKPRRAANERTEEAASSA